MKNLLYGTTALVAIGMAAGGVQAADKVKVGVGGYMQAFLVFGDEDDGVGEPANNLRNHKVAREGEIIFSGKTTLDNGIQFGVQVQLEAETCGDQLDETFMWASGGFGRINVGSENSAAYLMHYSAPAASHWAHGLQSPNFSHPATGGHASGAYPHTNPTITSDSEKITYFTPRFSGFQLGASYTPDNCEENNANGALRPACGGSYGGFQGEALTGSQSEVIELGANYTGKIGGASIGVSGSWAEADVEGATSAAVRAAGFEDQEEWTLGFKASMQGFSFGAGYRDDNQGTLAANSDRTDWNVGLRYATGPWGVGIQYANTEIEAGAAGGSDDLEAVEIGGSYQIGPGILMSAGVQFWEFDDNLNAAANENDASIVFVGTHIAF